MIYFVGYKDARNFRPLCVMLPKMSAYGRNVDETKYMSFLIKNDKYLEKYNEILDKVSNTIKKEFDSKPVYNEKYIKSFKIKSFEGKINIIFHSKKYQKKVLNVFVCQ